MGFCSNIALEKIAKSTTTNLGERMSVKGYLALKKLTGNTELVKWIKTLSHFTYYKKKLFTNTTEDIFEYVKANRSKQWKSLFFKNY